MVKQLHRDPRRTNETQRESTAGGTLLQLGNLPTYELPGDGLSMGASLGNSHCWITTRGRGEIDSFFSTDLGRIVMGSMLVRFSGLGTKPLIVGNFPPQRQDAYIQLLPEHPGMIVLHPAYQQHIL